MKTIIYWLLTTWSLALAACTNTKYVNKQTTHVLFNTLSQHLPLDVPATPTTPHILRLFLDADGSIYPGQGNISFAVNDKFSLSIHYATNPSELQSLASSLLIANTSSFSQVQDAMTAAYAGRLKAVLANGTQRRTLVVLVHGYNVPTTDHTAANPIFQVIRDSLTHRAPQLKQAVWLEVYWDGLTGNALRIWSAGQLNARYAGLRLRRLLAATDPATPIRIFTHSSGGIVATHALWNVYTPYHQDTISPGPNHDINVRTRELYKFPTPTHCDVRVGMIVPAMPGAAFYDFGKRTPSQALDAATCKNSLTNGRPNYRIVIGQNRKDFAVTKFRLLAGYFGVTTLGCRASDYSRYVPAATEGQAQRVDFCQNRKPMAQQKPFLKKIFFFGRVSQLEEHDWRLYLERPEFTEFVDKVMK